MRKAARLPARFPAGTKYVLEAHGRSVQRYIEFTDGSRIELRSRQALTCHCKTHRDPEFRAGADSAPRAKTERVAA